MIEHASASTSQDGATFFNPGPPTAREQEVQPSCPTADDECARQSSLEGIAVLGYN